MRTDAKKLLQMIDKVKKKLMSDEILIQAFEDYGVSISELQYIPIFFKDIDVAGKTDHAVIWLNWNLIHDGVFDPKDTSYLLHEVIHYLQQTTGTKPTKGADDGEYLDNPYEQEGFQYQIEFLADKYSDEEAEEYVDDLLDHHEVKDLENKKDKLLSRI